MKNFYTRLILLCTLTFLCTSCFKFKEVDMGFPANVTFTSEGGVMTVSGDVYPIMAEIHNYSNGEGGEIEEIGDSVMCNKYKWLRVEYNIYTVSPCKDIRIYAEPNTTGKSRKLHIEVSTGPEYDVIQVIQR